MAYDIPDEIKYREKIIANLDPRQLLYAIVFGIAAFLTYRLPFEGDAKIILPGFISVIGIAFIFFKFDEKLKDIFSYFSGLRIAPHNSIPAQKFFEVKSIGDDVVRLDDGRSIAVLEIQPINFGLLDESRRKAIMTNYKAFLNQLTNSIQILIRTKPVSLE